MHPRVTHEVCVARSRDRLALVERQAERPRLRPLVERGFGERWTAWLRRRWSFRLAALRDRLRGRGASPGNDGPRPVLFRRREAS